MRNKNFLKRNSGKTMDDSNILKALVNYKKYFNRKRKESLEDSDGLKEANKIICVLAYD